MRRCFVDAGHLVALINPKDQWHQKAIKASELTCTNDLVTTEDVLIEFLNFYAEDSPYMRGLAAASVRRWLLDMRISVIPHSGDSFLQALELYESRPDKGYSLTDCISMNTCKSLNIADVLTNDDHFRQEGFTMLL